MANEASLYGMLGMMMFFKGSEEEAEGRFEVGWWFIGFFIVWLTFSMTILAYQSLTFTRLLIKRSYRRFSYKQLTKSVSSTASIIRQEISSEKS